MAEIIECVPNISEGANLDVVNKVADRIRAVDGVRLLNVAPDAAQNRTVFTMVGDRKSLPAAVEALFEETLKHVDLTKHKGEHPRMGAVDVVPFVPVVGATTEECVELSREVGAMIAEKFKVPVYLYEDSATSPGRKNLAKIRKGEFEGFAEKIKDPEWKPDFGPAEVHPTAGCVAVSARPFLIAFNVNLGTDRLEVAEQIANEVRFLGGGLRFVKAKGFETENPQVMQVSMNLTNYEKTPIFRVVELIRREAARHGVSIVATELIGMSPLQALLDCVAWYLQLADFKREQVLEAQIFEGDAE
ncbi:MAG: glutamate formimidoyltransferase [Candidatus Coatesbacteria bacterium]|nr:MAG: glutamate formimidoyltransferase [Candidatus Coatesbacteria bacterium]